MCLCVSKAKFKLLLKGYFFKLISSNNRTPESWEGREKLANRFPVEPPPILLFSPSSPPAHSSPLLIQHYQTQFNNFGPETALSHYRADRGNFGSEVKDMHCGTMLQP